MFNLMHHMRCDITRNTLQHNTIHAKNDNYEKRCNTTQFAYAHERGHIADMQKKAA